MRRGTFVRWGVPIAVAAVIGGAIGAGPVIAAVSGDPVLPARSAQELLADAVAAVERAEGMPPLSGTVQQTASLGLPALPDTGEGSPLRLLSGSHEVKVWYGDHDTFRVAMPTQFNETNLIVDGGKAWYWDSAGNTATRLTYPAGRPPERAATPTPADLTPQQVARRVLETAGEHTAISVSNTAEVAGRSAYQLVLTPKEEGSLVQEVRLALDGEHYIPLRVQVFAKGSAEPAFQVGFTQLTFTPPAAENFAFTPPAGAEVNERQLSLAPGEHGHGHGAGAREAAGDVKVVGEGWAAVAVLPAPAPAAAGATPRGEAGPSGEPSRNPKALMDSLLASATPVSGPWGSGKVLRTKLVTVLLTDDGRLLAGPVTPEEIVKAAGVR